MQVPNVLDSLRNNEIPSFVPPMQWTGPLSEWADDIELYGRLKDRYVATPTKESANQWAAFMDTLRPIDWHPFVDFFALCPKECQTPSQQEIASKKRCTDPALAGVQMLYSLENNVPKWDALLRVPNCLVNMEMDNVQRLAQHAWEHSSDVLATKHLPARLTEFLNAYPHAVNTDDMRADGAGLLMAALLLGIPEPSFATNIGDDEHYYERACKNVSNKDLLRFAQCLERHPEWQKHMLDELEITWFDHFLKKDNPHHLAFGIYQSLDPTMNMKQLMHFLSRQNDAPPEQYSLESISIF